MTTDRPTIYLVGHAHIDLGYRWRWNETVHRVARDTFRGILRMMRDYPELTFVQSQLAIYEAMAREYPKMYREIKERIAEGRWVVVDGWCEYDHTMPSGEAMVRQHLLGSRHAREELGVEVRMAWAPDAFSGHVHTLPTILKGCGIDRFLFGRGVPGNTPYFWWEGPDGSRVLSYSPVYTYSATIGPQLLETMARWKALTGIDAMLVLYGQGDHGGGPREADLQALAELRAQPDAPDIAHTVPERFYEDVLLNLGDLPVYRGELGGGFTGSLSSEGRHKQLNRQMETLLLTAERFATISCFFQRKPVYPRVDMREAWKRVLHHQFHDELPGTSRAAVYEDNADDYALVTAQMASVLENALAEIGARQHTHGEGVPVMVYNPLGWARSEPARVSLRLTVRPTHLVMRDASGRALPTQVLSLRQEGAFWLADVLFLAREVPSLGYTLVRAHDEDQPPVTEEPLSATAEELSNAYLRVRVDPATGHLISLYDLRADREALAGPAHVLQAIAEQPGIQSAWIIALTDQLETLAAPESVRLVDDGPVRAAIRTTYRFRDSFFAIDTVLYAGMPGVEFVFLADWYERDTCLKVAFPAAVEGGVATFEAPYGHIVREADGEEVHAQNWVDLSTAEAGLSLLNDCRYAFDVRGNVMRMTLLRGIPDLDPRADMGRHELRYALYPHVGDWRTARTPRRGWELNMPLIARQELRRSGILPPWTSPGALAAMPPRFSFLQVEPENVVLGACKIEEEDWGQGSPIVVRLQEVDGTACEAVLRLADDVAFAQRTNHLEDPLEDDDTVTWDGDTVRVRLQPYEIATVRLRLAHITLGVDPDAVGRSEGFGGFAAGIEAVSPKPS